MTPEELQMIEFAREALRSHGYVKIATHLGVVVAKEKEKSKHEARLAGLG